MQKSKQEAPLSPARSLPTLFPEVPLKSDSLLIGLNTVAGGKRR